uniref:Uncharacterized protein n=1 Tax=Callorhinchus milii TaxID=7868 RepID=A0A4W3H626_CALMI
MASALCTNHSLTELILNDNDLGDCGVKRLCKALKNPKCKVQKLWLDSNNLTADCTEDLASALSRNHSLTELILNDNELGDCGVKRMCGALRNPECKIQKLGLESNNLTADCTEDLTSALSTNYSLTDLILNDNNLGDCGVKRLCEALRNPECKLKSLHSTSDWRFVCVEWRHIIPTEGHPLLWDLNLALRSLVDLKLLVSVWTDSLFVCVCVCARIPANSLTVSDSGLYTLLGINNLRADCTDDLTSALSTNHSLTELILNRNNLGDCGVKRLCEALRNPECKIKSLQ